MKFVPVPFSESNVTITLKGKEWMMLCGYLQGMKLNQYHGELFELASQRLQQTVVKALEQNLTELANADTWVDIH